MSDNQSNMRKTTPTRVMKLVLIVTGLILAAIVVQIIVIFSGNEERMLRVQCANNLRQIGAALRQYAADHDGHFPEGRQNTVSSQFRLLSNYLGNSAQIFCCPRDLTKVATNQLASITDANISYCYVRGLNRGTPANIPLCFDWGVGGEAGDGKPLSSFAGQSWKKESRHKGAGGTVLYCDGHTRFESIFPKPESGQNWSTNIVEVP